MMRGKCQSILKIDVISAILILSTFLYCQRIHAEVVYDGTLGPPGEITGEQHNDYFDYVIDAQFGQQVGANLFHSFETFNLYYYNDFQVAERAIFTGPADVENIISRVTGGSISSIDGTIQSDIAGANLFLINPAGVVFGPHAALDVSGSFHVSTADYLRMGETGVFDAVNPENSSLVSAPPSAFGFLGENPAPIVFSGSGSADAMWVADNYDWTGLSTNGMSVPSGQTLSVVGGDITITGGDLFYGWFGSWPVETQLQAPDGRINLVSLAAGGEVAIAPTNNLDLAATSAQGEITVNGGSVISCQGDSGAEIFIRGGRLVMDYAQILSENTGSTDKGAVDILMLEEVQMSNLSYIHSSADYGGIADDIIIEAPNIMLDDSLIRSFSDWFGAGTGNINLTGDSVSLTNDTVVVTATDGDGIAGNIEISADQIAVRDLSLVKSYSTYYLGAGGNLTLAGDSIDIENGRVATDTQADAKGGDINVTAGVLTISDGGYIDTSTSLGLGDAGNIFVNVDSLSISEHGRITSQTGYGASGNAGDVVINAAESVSITGLVEDSSVDTYTQIGSGTWFADGNAGTVSITTPSLVVSGGAVTSSSDLSMGAAGAIFINVDRLEVNNYGLIASNNNGSSTAGKITINAAEKILVSDWYSLIEASANYDGEAGSIEIYTPELRLENGGQIHSVSYSSGDAGNIYIEAGLIDLIDGGYIINDTQFSLDSGGNIVPSSGQGGNITVIAEEGINISNQILDIPYIISGFSSSTFGSGNGGRIQITTPSLVNDNGRIQAITFGAGDGGDIIMDVDTLTMTNGGKIDASTTASSSGRSGNVQVNGAESVAISGCNANDVCSGIDIATSGSGHSGNLSISAPEVLLDDLAWVTSFTFGSGNAGTIQFDVNSLEILGGAQVDSSTRAGGTGGDLNVNAAEYVSISGIDPTGQYPSGLFAGTSGSGNAGNLNIITPMLVIDNGRIRAETRGDGAGGTITFDTEQVYLRNGAQIDSGSRLRGENGSTEGTGGSVLVLATDTIEIDGAYTDEFHSGIFSNAESNGAGGNISLETNRLMISDGGLVSATSSGNGNAGEIFISLGDTLQIVSGAITTEAVAADGGNISVNADTLVWLLNSDITATVGTGFGNGGNITIDPIFIILDNSRIIANAYGGAGGNILLVADHFITDPFSIVQASSELGIDGSVVIDSPDTDVSGSLAVLPATYLDATALLQSSCMLRTGEAGSSLVVTGRGGMPNLPGEYLPSSQQDIPLLTWDAGTTKKKEEGE